MQTLEVDYAMATSGIAGPAGGTPEKPVGTIWIAAGNSEKVITAKLTEDEGREKNIQAATKIKKMSDKTIISYRKACVYKIKSLILHSV